MSARRAVACASIAGAAAGAGAAMVSRIRCDGGVRRSAGPRHVFLVAAGESRAAVGFLDLNDLLLSWTSSMALLR